MDTGRTPPSGGRRTSPRDDLAPDDRTPTADTVARTIVWRPVRAGVALATIVALILTSCGDDSGGDDEESSDDAAPTTTTTQPSATDDEDAAFAIVEDIFHERTGLTEDVYRNPQLIDDPDSTEVDRIRELSTGSMDATVATLVDTAQELLENDHHFEATDRTFTELGIYRLESTDADTIAFETCFMTDTQRVDADDEPVDDPVVEGYYGPGEARRVEGMWKISNIEYWDEYVVSNDDLSPGQLQRGGCESEFGDLINRPAEGQD